MKVIWMPIFWILFWLFIVNAFFLSALIVVYKRTFSYQQGFKMDAEVAKKNSQILIKNVLL